VPLYVAGVCDDKLLFTTTAKRSKNTFFVIAVNKRSFLDFLNHLTVLNVRDLWYPVIRTTPYYLPIYLFRNIVVISMVNYVQELMTTVISSHE